MSGSKNGTSLPPEELLSDLASRGKEVNMSDYQSQAEALLVKLAKKEGKMGGKNVPPKAGWKGGGSARGKKTDTKKDSLALTREEKSLLGTLALSPKGKEKIGSKPSKSLESLVSAMSPGELPPPPIVDSAIEEQIDTLSNLSTRTEEEVAELKTKSDYLEQCLDSLTAEHRALLSVVNSMQKEINGLQVQVRKGESVGTGNRSGVLGSHAKRIETKGASQPPIVGLPTVDVIEAPRSSTTDKDSSRLAVKTSRKKNLE